MSCNAAMLKHLNLWHRKGNFFGSVMKKRSVAYIICMYSGAHKLFGHSRVFILTIMICVKRSIFSNDCISKRLKDRRLKLFS